MTPQDVITAALNQSEFLWKPYILGMAGPDGQRHGGLNDADLLVRPCAEANHIAWQLGHLISSENGMIGEVCPGTMPELPAGFAEQHTRETAASDDPAGFHTIAEYVSLADEQRAGTLAALAGLSATDLQAESPEKFRILTPDVAGIFLLAGSHWLLHSGQWVIVRRQLGHPALFQNGRWPARSSRSHMDSVRRSGWCAERSVCAYRNTAPGLCLSWRLYERPMAGPGCNPFALSSPPRREPENCC